MLLKFDGKSTAVAVHDYAAFYDESNDDFNIDRVIRLVKTIDFQKSYVCFKLSCQVSRIRRETHGF